MTDTDVVTCLCGCGETVTPGASWKRGHFVRGVGGYSGPALLPGPDDDFDLGDLEPDADDGPGPDARDWGPGPAADLPDDGEIPPDDPPGPIIATPGRGRPRGSKNTRTTAALRKDIEAKVGMLLYVPGQVWAARDPYCGGAFVSTIPDQQRVWANLILDSPDVLEWFTGPAGGFMKWLEVIAVLQPVAVTVWAHHVAHAIGDDAGERPSARQYAA